jgi:hypothetical protein
MDNSFSEGIEMLKKIHYKIFHQIQNFSKRGRRRRRKGKGKERGVSWRNGKMKEKKIKKEIEENKVKEEKKEKR